MKYVRRAVTIALVLTGVVVLCGSAQPAHQKVKLGVDCRSAVVPEKGQPFRGVVVDAVYDKSFAQALGIPPLGLIGQMTVSYRGVLGTAGTITFRTKWPDAISHALDFEKVLQVAVTWRKNGIWYTNWVDVIYGHDGRPRPGEAGVPEVTTAPAP